MYRARPWPQDRTAVPGERRRDLRAFGEALADALGDRSQDWLAAQVGKTQAAVSKWINGRNEPDVDTVFALEAVLGLTPGELSAYLGYVPVDSPAVASVRAAIAKDPRLNARTRRVLNATYDALTG